MSSTQVMGKKIDELRARYYEGLPGKESLIVLLGESETAEHVYNSNAIENSTLTLDETEKILLDLDLERFINERELFEAKNLARVNKYIGTKAIEAPLSLEIVCLIHKFLMTNIRDDIAGRFRAEGEYVRVGNHIATHPKDIVSELEESVSHYNATVSDNIVNRIARFHLSFENIHPFVDGNGRIGRVLNNYLFLREGYVPINIKFSDRQQYYNSLRVFDRSGEIKEMSKIIGQALINSYYKRLAYMEDKKIMTLNDYSKTFKKSQSNLINKAKRQTIEAFLERGVWKIGT